MRRSNYKLFIEDILAAMDKIERYIEDLTYETFLKNILPTNTSVIWFRLFRIFFFTIKKTRI